MKVSITTRPPGFTSFGIDGEQRVQFFVFLIHRDAQRHEGLRGGMQFARTGHGTLDQLGQLTGRLIGRARTIALAILRLLLSSPN